MTVKSKEHKIYISSNKQNTYELTNKVIAVLFKEFRENIESCETVSLTNKKKVLKGFEKVIKCLRREILGIRNLYEKQEDNIEVLIELSEILDIKLEFEELFNEYKNICSEEIEIMVNVNVSSEIQKFKLEKERNIPDGIKIKFLDIAVACDEKTT
ncbi:hypothetical protein D3C76_1448990 [compost metagenome]